MLAPWAAGSGDKFRAGAVGSGVIPRIQSRWGVRCNIQGSTVRPAGSVVLAISIGYAVTPSGDSVGPCRMRANWVAIESMPCGKGRAACWQTCNPNPRPAPAVAVLSGWHHIIAEMGPIYTASCRPSRLSCMGTCLSSVSTGSTSGSGSSLSGNDLLLV